MNLLGFARPPHEVPPELVLQEYKDESIDYVLDPWLLLLAICHV